jgi:phenylalanyl-tRNA synthetase beta chain
LSYSELAAAVQELASERVEAMELADRWSGEGLQPGVVRSTLRLTYRHRERSLTQDEVNADHERLRQRLADRLGVRFA